MWNCIIDYYLDLFFYVLILFLKIVYTVKKKSRNLSIDDEFSYLELLFD